MVVTLFNPRSRLGLWEFSHCWTDRATTSSWCRPGPLAGRVGRVDQRALIIGATARMRAAGKHRLYDTVDAGYLQVRRTWPADQQNILVVMTDGKNEDLHGCPCRS
jgi:hypothetical protein